MKRNIITMLIAASYLVLMHGCEETDYYPRPESIPAPETFTFLTEELHPRILMTEDDFTNLKSRIESGKETNVNAIHELIMRVTDVKGMASAPLKFQLDESGKRILTVSRDAILRIFNCAYAYKTTGEKKYLEHAENDINTVCDFVDWNAKKHFLDAAEMCTAVALGYDWLYNDLRDDTMEKAEKAIREFAFTPALGGVWNLNFYNSTSNWNQVCNGGLVIGALAIYEKCPVTAQEIINKAIASNPAPMRTMYAPDGNYTEGYSYWCYGTTFECLMLSALESVTGKDYGLYDLPGFSKTGEFMQYMEGINNAVFNYSDCGVYSSFLLPQWYFAEKSANPSILYSELKKLPALTGAAAGTEERLLPMVMAFVKDVDLDRIEIPSKKVWYGNGVNPLILVKTGWDNSAEDKYLGFKGGRARNSHAHMDTGSFVYDAYGIRWACDLGGTSYTKAELAMKEAGGNFWNMRQESMRWDFMRLSNKLHNTITINGAKHQVETVSPIVDVYDSGEELGGTVDLTPAVSDQAAKALRTAKIAGNKDLVITDDITALSDKEAAVRWTMMTQADVTVENDRIILSRAGKTMYLTAASDGPEISFRQFSLEPVQPYDDDLRGQVNAIGFEAVIPAGSKAVFTARLSAEQD